MSVATFLLGAAAGQAVYPIATYARLAFAGDSAASAVFIGAAVLAPLHVLAGFVPYLLLRRLTPQGGAARWLFLAFGLSAAVLIFNFLIWTYLSGQLVSPANRPNSVTDWALIFLVDFYVSWAPKLTYLVVSGAVYVFADRKTPPPKET